jgi:hypothetical protein
MWWSAQAANRTTSAAPRAAQPGSLIGEASKGGRVHRRGSILLVASAVVGAAAIAAVAPPAAAVRATRLKIQVLSTRADLVSGPDALTAIALPARTRPRSVRVRLNGHDVTREFAVRRNGRLEGLLSPLRLGRNVVVASVPHGAFAQITITDHPQSGPVFSGPQAQPWSCNPGTTGAGCEMTPTYTYEYMPAGASNGSACTISQCASLLQPYNPSNPPPPQAVATTTTDQGRTVPFIIRIETGSINRGQYQIAVLYNPAQRWQPWAPQAGWNGKLEIPGGASCGTGHVQGTSPTVTDTHALSLGFAVASDSLLNNGENCNIVTQAETAAMLKEYFVDHYGPIRYTIATGCSGGSIFQQQTNNAYPGLYQGEIVECSFPDDWSTSIEPIDCQLLLAYLDSPRAAADLWTPAEEAAVFGGQSASNCQTWVNVYGYNKLADPSGNGSNVGPACGVPAANVYNASNNPAGVRCDLQDYMVNVFGERPPRAWTAPERAIRHGFANVPYDNVGVQYGLNALMSGEITPQQFADLNAGVGGLTVDDRPQAARSAADPAAPPRLYRSGAINEYNNLAGVPIIDLRGHDTEEIHDDFRSYAARARLDRATGGHGNQVIWLAPVPLAGDARYVDEAFDLMNRWLANIEADRSARPLPEKVLADRPPGAVDECFDGAGQPIQSQQACQTLFPPYANPRIAAGAPYSDDVMKCRLKPLRRSDYYPVQFTDSEWAELEAAFPSGVCDYSKPGIGQQGAIPWLTYQNARGRVIYGGKPLGPAPAGSGLGWTSPAFAGWLGR